MLYQIKKEYLVTGYANLVYNYHQAFHDLIEEINPDNLSRKERVDYFNKPLEYIERMDDEHVFEMVSHLIDKSRGEEEIDLYRSILSKADSFLENHNTDRAQKYASWVCDKVKGNIALESIKEDAGIQGLKVIKAYQEENNYAQACRNTVYWLPYIPENNIEELLQINNKTIKNTNADNSENNEIVTKGKSILLGLHATAKKYPGYRDSYFEDAHELIDNIIHSDHQDNLLLAIDYIGQVTERCRFSEHEKRQGLLDKTLEIVKELQSPESRDFDIDLAESLTLKGYQLSSKEGKKSFIDAALDNLAQRFNSSNKDDFDPENGLYFFTENFFNMRPKDEQEETFNRVIDVADEKYHDTKQHRSIPYYFAYMLGQGTKDQDLREKMLKRMSDISQNTPENKNGPVVSEKNNLTEADSNTPNDTTVTYIYNTSNKDHPKKDL